MSDLVPLNSLFDIKHGNKLDKNKQVVVEGGINFVSRQSQNLGVNAKVEEIEGIKPYPSGLITVTLGGSFLLSAFVQQAPFYTAQNIKILSPKEKMNFRQKVYYCQAISKNRFRYHSHGREANITLDNLRVPSLKTIPKWVSKTEMPTMPSKKPKRARKIELDKDKWENFELINYFNMYAGKYYPSDFFSSGKTPLISASDENNGISFFTDLEPCFPGNCLTIGKINCITYFQSVPFCATADVTTLCPKFDMNIFSGLFISTMLNAEKYKWSYGRQIRLNDSKLLNIKLPTDKNNKPDWQFMENYIKTLPYSSGL